MRRLIRYLSHPEVVIDPDTPVPEWSLSEVGHQRIAALAASGVLTGTVRVISSAETKARQAAAPLARTLACPHEVRPAMHENDRSATGFLPGDQFEAVADQFFANPDVSIKGWETASGAQARILSETRACLEATPDGDLLLVGHGAVGTLLYCHLAGVPISRAFDQPHGGGCLFAFEDLATPPRHGWQRIETLIGGHTT